MEESNKTMQESQNSFNVFDEYALLLEDTAKMTDRRQQISNNYLSMNSLIIFSIGFLLKDSGLTSFFPVFITLPLGIAGCYICIFWHQLIEKSKQLIALRMKYLRDMEELDGMKGSIQIFHKEDALYIKKSDGYADEKQFKPFSNIEQNLPKLFIILYILFFSIYTPLKLFQHFMQ